MPLVKKTLEDAIKAALVKNQKPDGGNDPQKQINDSIQDLSQDLATAIDAYIRTATVTTPSGPGAIS